MYDEMYEMDDNLTPTERLIVYALRIRDGQTAPDLQAAIGAKATAWLVTKLRVLMFARVIELRDGRYYLAKRETC